MTLHSRPQGHGAAQALRDPGMARMLAPATALARWRPGWPEAAATLGLGAVLLGLLFAAEAMAAVATWERSSAYGHCWLVLPVAAWLGWVRRDALRDLRPAPQPLWSCLALGPLAAWLVAERLGIMEGRQFAALGLVWVLVLVTLGWRCFRAMAGPLGYLVFLVPFGEFATPWLQQATLWILVAGLRLVGVPHFVDGMVIDTPAGIFLVAEACAGLRFMIAALAFGALYALLMFRSPLRRALVMLLAVTVPLLANGLRALGIVLWGQLRGSAEAGAADHLIYGWVFFSIVILLLVLAGLPFREDRPTALARRPAMSVPAAQAVPPPDGRRLVLAAGLVLFLAAIGPVGATILDRGSATPPRRASVELVAAPGCSWDVAAGLLTCPGVTLSAELLVFAPGTGWARVAEARRRLGNPSGDDEAAVFPVTTPGAEWQARQGQERADVVGIAAWLDGRPAGDGLRMRAAQAWRGLRGEGGTPVLVVVTLRPLPGIDASADGARERRIMQAVLTAQPGGLAMVAAAGVAR